MNEMEARYNFVKAFLDVVGHRKPSWIHQDSLEAIKGMDDRMIRDIAEGKMTPVIRVKSIKNPEKWELTSITLEKLMIGGHLLFEYIEAEGFNEKSFILFHGEAEAEDIAIQLSLLGDVYWHFDGKLIEDKEEINHEDE